MPQSEQKPDLHPLADIDPIIHSSARLMVLTYLYVVESVDYVFLKNITGLTWGNLSTHLSKLEKAEYVEIEKECEDKKPRTTIRLTERGRDAFKTYKEQLLEVLDELPD